MKRSGYPTHGDLRPWVGRYYIRPEPGEERLKRSQKATLRHARFAENRVDRLQKQSVRRWRKSPAGIAYTAKVERTRQEILQDYAGKDISGKTVAVELARRLGWTTFATLPAPSVKVWSRAVFSDASCKKFL